MADLELTKYLVPGEPVSFADAMDGSFIPIRVGDRWGPPWSTTWFHVRGHVPDEWAGRRVVAVFDLGYEGPTGFTCEALAWKDGRPWRGVDPNHRWLPIDERTVDFYLEAAANPGATEQGPDPAPSMIELRQSTEPAFVLRQASLELWEPPAAGPVPLELGSHVITAVGHAHIDTAWEWPLREARRKCARSWSTQLALMDEYPDYVFAASQPAQYAWIKESHPDLYARIARKVGDGQWEPVGAMWVEADCNLPSGEALVRQLLHGKRFFMQEFGYETRILWLPDVFGYPGNLPQLMKEAGCDYFMTQKLSWNDTNKPQHHTFTWEGIDGSRVFTHFPPADTYNGSFASDEIAMSVRNFKDADRSNRSLYLFGLGDGGGGPTPEMIDSAHRLGVKLGRSAEFFERSSADANDLVTVTGELYFELHRGTYTSQSSLKRLNRFGQRALREAEMWSVAGATAYGPEDLNPLWKTLLLNQFHDILPGSSIDWVYEEAEPQLKKVNRRAREIAAAGRSAVAGRGRQVAFFNSTSHWRREVGQLDGNPISIEAPPCGWSTRITRVADEGVSVSDGRMENALLRVEWNDRRILTSIWDKEAGREVLSAKGNVLELHVDNPKRWDAWDLDAEHRDSYTEVTAIEQVKTSGGVIGGLALVRKFGESRLSQLMSLAAGSRVLRFQTIVDWHERHRILKVAFPVAVHSREATYEVQFGHVRRPTHMDTPQARAMFEVCAQRWADLGDGEYGVALLNDCKHGYDIHDSVMRLSLLRAPTHPDPNADQGTHIFDYALMPHLGDFREAGVIQAAEDLNSPLESEYGNLAADTLTSLIEVDTRQVIVEAIKRAEDSDAVIVRLYEAWGRSCTALLKTTLPARRATLCDLLERERTEVHVRDGVLELAFTPFKIVTLKLDAGVPGDA